MQATGKYILIVDDDPIDLQFAKSAIEDVAQGIQVREARDGIDALEVIRDHGNPQIILLDLNMPRMDGRHLLNMLKKNPETRSTPIIILSTANDQYEINQSYETHANAYIVKPDTPDSYRDLLSVIYSFWLDTVSLPH